MNYGHQLCGDYFKNHEIRIPSLNDQDSMESKAGVFRGSNKKVVCKMYTYIYSIDDMSAHIHTYNYIQCTYINVYM